MFGSLEQERVSSVQQHGFFTANINFLIFFEGGLAVAEMLIMHPHSNPRGQVYTGVTMHLPWGSLLFGDCISKGMKCCIPHHCIVRKIIQ